MLCDDLDGCDGGWGEGEAQEGGDVCKHIGDLLCCSAETNTTLKSNYTLIERQTITGYDYENDYLNSDEADERTGLWIVTKRAQKHSLTKSDYTFPISEAMYNSRPPLKPKILTQ